MTDYHNPFVIHTKKPHDPKMIGLWKVGRTLGKGFSGHVRIARHSKTGQYAAIKIIPKGSLSSRVSLNRLADEVEHNLLAVEREIVVMKLIDHPNIMKLYDVWETSSSLYLILEYVQGGELFDYLCSKGRRPVSEALDYFQQIICAVDYCHRFNIAHRDLKLENILIDHESNIKVADFGMATWQDNARGKLLKTSCGSPHYAAPEIISGRPYDGATSDIWSCGIILYALLAARLPFDDDDCTALLRKISIGHFDMPQDIPREAQDLIGRMLTLDVKKRITMSEIMRHPFFVSQPLKNPLAMPKNPNMVTLAHPIKTRSAIDPDIFANLRTLWHGVPDDELVESLMNSERTWQKGIYHLLVTYRKKYHDLRYDEDEAALGREQTTRASRKLRPAEVVIPPRNDPPTPRRARDRTQLLTTSSEMSLVHIHYPGQGGPEISFSAPSPSGEMRDYDRLPHEPLSCLVPPELEDEKMQHFFRQVADHLNVLQARTVSGSSNRSASPALSSSSKTPPMLEVDIPSPIKLRYEQNEAGGHHRSVSPAGYTSDDYATKPLTLRHKGRLLRPTITIDTNDKENRLPVTESDIMHRQSPLTRQTARLADANRLQIVETPMMRRPSKLKKKRVPTNPPVSPMFSEAGSSFTFPSPVGAQRRSWLDNMFKFRPATYSLLSRYDVHTTRGEARRLLTEMDMLVALEDAEKLGVLKCRSQDVKDPSNIMAGLKTVKFRVELQWPAPSLCREGYVVALLVVQEKGPLEGFKAIFQELERVWTLDGGSCASSMASFTPSSINTAYYLDRQSHKRGER